MKKLLIDIYELLTFKSDIEYFLISVFIWILILGLGGGLTSVYLFK